jgi:hypothetical protein
VKEEADFLTYVPDSFYFQDQCRRSHPIRVPGDAITLRIRECRAPNKDILITKTVGTLLARIIQALK